MRHDEHYVEALAASAGIVEWESTEATVRSLQEYHRDGQLRLEV